MIYITPVNVFNKKIGAYLRLLHLYKNNSIIDHGETENRGHHYNTLLYLQLLRSYIYYYYVCALPTYLPSAVVTITESPT